MTKKVLFINPNIFNAYHGTQPHYGLGCLARILKDKGHEVKILDYAGFRGLPEIEDFIDNEYKPDVIGITTYSPAWSIVKDLIARIKKYDVPVILGGPHTACYKEDLMNYKEVDCIVIGESEDIICDVIENVKKDGNVDVITGMPPKVDDIPYPDMTAFIGQENINRYLVQASRGCPFNCSFCVVEITNTRKWRPRKIDDVIDEIRLAVEKHKKIDDIYIVDDIFTLKMERAKEFLRKYLSMGFRQRLIISNVRADSVDKELMELLLEAGTMYLALGVESANKEVFDATGKKETIEEIYKSVELFNREKMLFNCYMIIGLPHDNFERVKESIKFIRKSKPNMVIWSMIIPFKGTRARDWFDENGTVFHEEQYNFEEDDIIMEPSVETPDFTREQRKKAYLKARLATCAYDWRHPIIIIKRIPLIIKYGLLFDFFSGLIWGFQIRARREWRKMKITRRLRKKARLQNNS